MAYEYKFTGKVYLLIIRNALYFKEMEINLILPFIIQLAGLTVNEEPKFMVTNPTLHHHSIKFPSKESIFPLSITGIFYLSTRKPSTLEMDMCDDYRIEIKPPFSNWNPYTPGYGQQEHILLNHDGIIND